MKKNRKNNGWRRAVLIGATLIGWGTGPATVLARPAGRLPGSVIPALARARRVAVSAPEAHQSLTLTLVLRRTHPRRFKRYLHGLYDPRSPRYRHFLSGRALADRFGPSRAEYARVLRYLRAQGFHAVAGSADRLTVTMRASRARIERALRIHIGDYRIGERRFYANDRAPWLPASIAPGVQAIVGLSDFAQPAHIGSAEILSQFPPQEEGTEAYTCWLAHRVHNGTTIAPAGGLVGPLAGLDTMGADAALTLVLTTLNFQCATDELNLVAAYAAGVQPTSDHQIGVHSTRRFIRSAASSSSGTGSSLPGAGETVGLLEFDTFHPSDVQNYLNLIGLGSSFGNLSEVAVNGGVSTPGSGESEVLLDIDAVMSEAPGAKVVVFDGPFQGRGTFQSMLNAMISAGVNVISNSWAYCENETDLADVQSINSILQTAAADGITVVSGAGDHGSTCLDGAANTIPVPADAPYITAVGGTSAQPNLLGTYGSETWWNGANGTPPTGQGGFGVSRFFPAPAYQSSLSSSTMRSVPDVSAPADPLHGYRICQADAGGCPTTWLYGGTSVAAPIWAGFVAVLDQALGKPLGFLNPILYPLAGSGAFHSAASMGSDFAHVGLGSPNVGVLKEILAGQTPGAPVLADSAIRVFPLIATAGTTSAGVAVLLRDANYNPVSGQSVTLTANSGSHAQIVAVDPTTTADNGAALFTVTDSVPEVVTLTASTSGGALPSTGTLTFVSPPAASGGINVSPTLVTANGSDTATITVTLKDASGNPSPGKIVGLSQGNGASQISATTATTDATGTVSFTATDETAETVTYTATDITDGNLPVPGSAQVQFTSASGPPPCNVGLGTAGAGYTVSTFASGFFYNASCIGPVGIAFDPQGDLLVGDASNGNLYQFSPEGGSADPGHLIGTPFGSSVQLSGLVFGRHGSLYASARAGGLCTATNDIAQLDPSTAQIIRQLNAPDSCVLGLAIDPLSGDMFVSDTFGGIFRLSGYSTGPGTYVSYALAGAEGVDAITFAPDGTLYAANESSGVVYSITGTNSATPGVATAIATIAGADGITLVTNPADASLPYVIVNANSGEIIKIDQTTSPATLTTIYSGGSRGDFVTVGPDGCMYATQTDRVIRITNADGTCDFQPVSVTPQVHLVADFSGAPQQGGTVSFTASLQNVANPAGTPIELAVSGANGGVHEGIADANGNVTLSYQGVYPGADQVAAGAMLPGLFIVSSPLDVNWAAGAHTTFIGLNDNPALVAANQPLALTANLLDVSANPEAPLASQTVELSLDGQGCSAATDSTGTASCTVTPITTGVATLSAAFAGGTHYVAAAATRRIDVLTPPPTVSISVTPASISAGSSATLDWSSTNASACSAGGAWSGSQATAGSQTVSPATSGTDTYTLTCTDADGSASASAALTVAAAASSGSGTVSGHSGGGGALSIRVLALLAGLLALRLLASRDRTGARRRS